MTADHPESAERLRERSDAREWAAASMGRERVILVDPDASEADRIRTALERRGVSALTFTNPWRALAHLGSEPAAVVVVSTRLGTESLGVIVGAIRDETTHPVLIAYYPEELDAIGPAVVAGGRPMVSLPYDAHELVRVLSEVIPMLPPPACVEFGRLSVVAEWKDAHVDGVGLALSPLEFRVLAELVRRDGRAASRDALIAASWDEEPSEPYNLLTAAVKRLRSKFEMIGIPDAVETIRGVGYRLNARALAPRDQAGKTPISAMSPSTRIEISSTIRRTS